MHEIKVITISAEEAEHGVAELWTDGRQIAYTLLDDGELKLRFPPRHDGTPVTVGMQKPDRGPGRGGKRGGPASPDTGVNTLTGEGLADVLEGAEVLIDASNSPSFEDEAVMDFFTTSTTNLLAAAADAGVRHYVALSVVGADRVPESGYLRAKVAQEKLIDGVSIPYTIVRATQFFEFVTRIGAVLQERSLVPDNADHLGEIRFRDWRPQPAKA